MRFFSGIRFTLILLVLLTLIPAWALFLYLGKAERENLVRATKREMLGLARLTSAQFLAVVEGTHRLLQPLAKTREVREGDSQACSELLASLLEGHPLYANLLVTGPDGKAWCSAIPEAVGVDYSDRDWFQRAIVERRFVMGAYVVGKVTGKPIAPSAYPVLTDSGELAGVIVAALDLSWLNRMLAGLPLPEGAVLSILGADGTVLARSSEPERWVGQSALQTEIGRWVLEHPDQQAMESVEMDGKRRLFAYTRLGEGSLIPEPSTMGYVILGIPTAQVQEASDRVLLRSLMGLSVVTLLSLAIAWVGGDYLVRRRIISLLSATRRMAQGDLSARTGISYGKSELSELARGFDEMAQRLEDQRRGLRRAVEELRKRDERLSHLLEVSPVVIYTMTPGDLRITWVSPNVRGLLGFTPEEVLEPKWWEENLHPDDAQDALSMRGDVFANERLVQEYRFKRKDGRIVVLRDETRLLRDSEGKPLEVIGAWVDITEKRFAEETILRQLQALRALFHGAQQLAERLDPEAAAKEVARICVEVLGASLAWLGRKEPDGEVKLISQFPEDHPYPRSISVRWDETPEGQGPTGRAIRGGNPEICSDILQEPSFGSWGEAAQAHGFKSSVAIPLITRGKVFGALNLYSAIPGFFAPDTMEPLKALANLAAAALENARLFAETTSRLKKVQALRNIDIAITSSLDLRVTLKILLDEVTTQLGVDAADVLLLNPYSQALEFAAGRGFRGRKIEATRMRLGEGYAGRAALERRVLEVRDLAQAQDFLRKELLVEEGFVSFYCAPMVSKGRVLGVLETFHRSPLNGGEEWVEFLEALAGQAAIAVDNANMFSDLERSALQLREAYDATIEGWSKAMDLRDKETEGHSQRVTELTVRIARAMGVAEEEIIHIRRGALLHDMGKMGIPDHILLKPGPLDPEEWEIMRKHPVYAFEMLSPIAYLRPALDIPYCHHEKWDGSGYPRGIKGDQIPLAARIFAVVDVWDALTSDRPYRPAWPKEKAIEEIKAGAGKHFDQRVVEVFLSVIEESSS